MFSTQPRKPWNPYIRRHSALTEKSGILKEHHLRQYAGWSPSSQMHLKYLHYLGNESSESLLEAYGIVTKDKQSLDTLRPKQCPNCSEPNKPDSKFCAKCRMVLTYDAYSETLESEKQKEDKLTIMEKQFNAMQSQIQSLISAFSSMRDQTQVDGMAKPCMVQGLSKRYCYYKCSIIDKRGNTNTNNDNRLIVVDVLPIEGKAKLNKMYSLKFD